MSLSQKQSFEKALAAALCACLLIPFAGCDTGNAGGSSPESALSADSSSETGPKKEYTFNYSGTDYPVSAVNEDAGGAGFFYFDRTSGAVSAPARNPETEGEYTDLAVCNGILCAVFENTPAILPEAGFVIRVSGKELKRKPEAGISMRCALNTAPYRPEEYVDFGSAIVEVRYRNIVRIDDNAGFLFDEGWYNASTKSNRYGTEIAVGNDGTVVRVNPSGTETSGDTPIPEGGFVLAVGQGSTCENSLSSVAEGSKAELVSEKHLYTVRKYTISSKECVGRRPDNTILYLSAKENAKTPAGSGTDVLVGEDGTVLGIYAHTEGGNGIPENGYAVCASGKYAYPVATAAEAGDKCILSGAKVLCFVRTPLTLKHQFSSRLSEDLSDMKKWKDAKLLTDASVAESALAEAKKLLEETFSGDGKDGERLSSVRQKLELAETELLPNMKTGVRAAWVTLGENDAEGHPFLHYTDEESVRRTVAYASRLNINTLIIDNLASGYAVYPSSVPGLLPHPELNGLDLIRLFSDACKEKNIRLIVMFSALMSYTSGTDYPEGHYTRLLEKDLLKTQKGRTSDGYGASSFDPSSPAVRQMIADMVAEIARNYPSIYGIQADYIRYPLPVYYQQQNYEDFGYGSPASESFMKAKGKDPALLSIGDPLWEDWCAWRRQVIDSLASEISGAARKANPSLEMSFTCFADADDRRKYVMQEPEVWAENGVADAIYPMIYANNTEDQRKYAEGFSGISSGCDVVLGVGTYVRATEKSIAEQLLMPYELGFAGASVFTLRYISVCGYNDVFEKVWREPASP